MAVTQTGAIYKALSFDNLSSRSFGVYITGEAVYNAPERDVEMITIPGRNGSFALDNGRFENITVTYPAGIFADNEADFADAISDFRNWMCSRKGYVRLSDEYNPGEYRLAVYRSGLEVTPAQLRAGEFTITFDCKPQRFLTSGETAEAVTSGGTITNPTLFESKPLLLAEGYGDISIGGGTITIDNVPLGNVKIADAASGPSPIRQPVDYSVLNLNDNINFAFSATYPSHRGPYMEMTVNADEGYRIDSVRGIGFDGSFWPISKMPNKRIEFFGFDVSTYHYTTTDQMISDTWQIAIQYAQTGDDSTLQTAHYTGLVRMTLNYGNRVMATFVTITPTEGETPPLTLEWTLYSPEIYGDSTKSALAQPAFIDLDIGEAYGEIGDSMVSLNGNISIPAELPTLAPGANTITYDNTITSLQVIPRWWKI